MLPNKETLVIEFKSDIKSYPDKDLVEAIAAMANTQGGELYLGIEREPYMASGTGITYVGLSSWGQSDHLFLPLLCSDFGCIDRTASSFGSIDDPAMGG